MIGQVEAFARLLRRAGVRVSTAELLDAARAVAEVGVGDGGAVHDALRATLVKRAVDAEAFEELYELHFRRGATLSAAGVPLAELLADQGVSPAAVNALIARLAAAAAELGAVARMALGVRHADFAPMVRAAGLEVELSRMSSPLQVGFYTHRLTESMDLRGASAELEAMLVRLADAGSLAPDELALLRAVIARHVVALRQAIRDYVQRAFKAEHRDYFTDIATRALDDKPLAQLSEHEVSQLREEVARLARILRAKVQHHREPRRRGRLDVRHTVRRSVATGGIPFEIVRRDRRRRKPRLVVLCDISDSVRNVSRFMLQFVYTLHELFDRIHTFAFVAELGELTELFRRYDLDRAVALAYSGAVINVFANSNYGRVLQQFAERHMGKLTPRTTVLVIGDGRNNYHASNHAVLADMRRRARRVIWMNPETPASWGFGDSAMREYELHCDEVAVARDLASLERVIDELVL